MSWTKRLSAALVVAAVSLGAVKAFDTLYGWLAPGGAEALAADGSSLGPPGTARSVVLREHRPDTDAFVVSRAPYLEHLLDKRFRVRTDSQGFILGPGEAASRQSPRADIIFFGGSTTECLYVEEENRFPYVVSQKLRGPGGASLQVRNGGVSGNHGMHSLLALLAKGVSQEPKYVVLMHAINDVNMLAKTLSYWNAPGSRALVQVRGAGDKTGLRSWLRSAKDFLVPNIWPQVRHVFAFGERDEWADYRGRPIAFAEVESAIRKEFRSTLVSFVRVSKAWGAEPILMTQFNRVVEGDDFVRAMYKARPQPLSYEEFVRLYRMGNDVVRQVAREEGVFLIDLDAKVERSAEFLHDSVHLSTKGSLLVADLVSDALAQRYPQAFQRASPRP